MSDGRFKIGCCGHGRSDRYRRVEAVWQINSTSHVTKGSPRESFARASPTVQGAMSKGRSRTPISAAERIRFATRFGSTATRSVASTANGAARKCGIVITIRLVRRTSRGASSTVPAASTQPRHKQMRQSGEDLGREGLLQRWITAAQPSTAGTLRNRRDGPLL